MKIKIKKLVFALLFLFGSSNLFATTVVQKMVVVMSALSSTSNLLLATEVCDKKDKNAFFTSILTHNLNAVEDFIDRGIDPNTIRDKVGISPLMYAAVVGAKGVTKTLINNGADPTLTDPSGLDALYYAKIMVEETIEEILREGILGHKFTITEDEKTISTSELALKYAKISFLNSKAQKAQELHKRKKKK